jgi:hypothetical protein
LPPLWTQAMPLAITRSVAVKLDPPSNWTVVLQREPDDSITIGVIYGDKDTMSQYTTLSAEDFGRLLRELGQ